MAEASAASIATFSVDRTPALPIFAIPARAQWMATMNISLPEQLKAFVDTQVEGGSYGTSSEYIRTLIRREQEREALRTLLLDGARSGYGHPADSAYFDTLRSRTDDPSTMA